MSCSRFGFALLAVVFAAPSVSSQNVGEKAAPLVRLGSERFLHPAWVRSIIVLPGEKELATVAEDVLRLWDRTGRVARTFSSGGSLTTLAVSPDGKYLAGGESSRVLTIWEAGSGRVLHRHQAKNHPIPSWSAEGKLLAYAAGTEIVVLETQGWSETRRFSAHDEYIRNVTFAGEFLVSAGGKDKRVSVWEPHSGKHLHDLEGGVDFRGCLAVSPDGKRLAADSTHPLGGGSYRSLTRVWDVASGKKLFDLPGSGTNAAVFGPVGEVLFTGDHDGRIRMWDLKEKEEILQWYAHVDRTSALAVSADGRTLFSGGSDRRLRQWDLRPLEKGKPPLEIDPPTGHSGTVQDVAFSPDGRRLASVGLDGTLRLWESRSGKALRSTRLERTPWGLNQVAFTADGRCLVVRQMYTGTARFRVFDASTLEEILSFGEKALHVSDFRLLPDEETLVAACWEGSLAFFELARGKLLRKVPVSKHALRAVAANADGSILAWGGDGPALGLWDPRRGKELRRFEGSRLYDETSVHFSPDGSLLATSCGSDAVRLWDVATGRQLWVVPGTNNSWTSDFSPDGLLLGSAVGKKITLADRLSRRVLQVFEDDLAEVKSIAFSPNGRMLATASHSGLISLWDLTGGIAKGGDLPSSKFEVEKMEVLWNNLAGDDGNAAAWRLAASEDVSAFLRKRLRPIVFPKSGRVDRLLADLDDEDFLVRQRATQQLANLGQAVLEALRKTAAASPSAESRGRAARLAARYEGEAAEAERRRTVRAVAALERNGTHAARKLLRELAAGAPAALLTREAGLALQRLESRAGKETR